MAFVLYELEGHTCAVIAQMLEIPEGTVHSRLHAARQKFLRLVRRPCPLNERNRP